MEKTRDHTPQRHSKSQSKGQQKGKAQKGKAKGSFKSSKGKGKAPPGKSSWPGVTKRVHFLDAPSQEHATGTGSRARSPTPPGGRKPSSKGVLKETSKYRPADEENQASKVHRGDEEEMDPYEKSSPKPEEWKDLAHRSTYRQHRNPNQIQKGTLRYQRYETPSQQPWQKEQSRLYFQKRRGLKKR